MPPTSGEKPSAALRGLTQTIRWASRRSRAPSARAIRHVWLTDQILQVHAASHGTYGTRRVHVELTFGRS